MSATLLFILLYLIQIYFGLWLISFVNKERKGFELRIEHVFLSFLLGMGISSIMVLFMDILFIPLNKVTVCLIHVIFFATLWFLDTRYTYIEKKKIHFDLSKYDIIPVVFILGISFISIWRTLYYPPYSYDSMMGIDLIAKYAQIEGSISDSKLFYDLVPRASISSNQLFYAPFTMLMQVLTRLIGLPFGQVWLGLFASSFWVYFYLISRREIHPILAQIGVYLLILAPEYFAYSFILQTDFCNAAFFFIGVYYFHKYIVSDHNEMLYLSMIGMFFACWSRTETIFFIPFGSLYLLIRNYLNQNRVISLESFRLPVLFTVIPTISVAIWSLFYVKFYLPKTANLFGQMGFEVSGILDRITTIMNTMNTLVVFSDFYWGYIVYIFIFVLVASLPFVWLKKRFDGVVILYYIFVLYVIFLFLTIIFPAVSVQNTFRRGFFKFLPLFSFFIVCSPLLNWLNGFLIDKTGKKIVSN